MGMYDSVKVNIEMLPVTPEERESLKYAKWQTKDIDCDLNTITISKEKVVIQRVDYEIVPEEERPFGHYPGIMGLTGMLRQVNVRNEEINYPFEFYNRLDGYKFLVRVEDNKTIIVRT